jgi:hypothetical protein
VGEEMARRHLVVTCCSRRTGRRGTCLPGLGHRTGVRFHWQTAAIATSPISST